MRIYTLIITFLLAASAEAQATPFNQMGRVYSLFQHQDAVYAATQTGVYLLGDDAAERISEGPTVAGASLGENQLLLARGVDDEIVLRRLDLSDQSESNAATPAPSYLLTKNGDTVLAVGKEAIYRQGEDGWQVAGGPPERTVDIDALPNGQLLAGTMQGLQLSEDGEQWQAATLYQTPATAIAENNGQLYVFQIGMGLLRSPVGAFDWQTLSNGFGAQIPTDLAANGDRLYAATHMGRLFRSNDGGETWRRIDRPDGASGKNVALGREIYQANCVSCHGREGVGEAKQLGSQVESLAPALDETMHAWHHTDDNLFQTIKQGTGGRMPGWGEALEDDEIRAVIGYMKSLWDERALRCQGPAHMSPACRGG